MARRLEPAPMGMKISLVILLLALTLFLVFGACSDAPTDVNPDDQEVVPGDPVTWAFVAVGFGAFFDFTCALTESGRAYCWGDGGSKIGNHNAQDYNSIPLPVTGDFTFTRLSTGWRHACGLTTEGTGYCWGDGNIQEGNAAAGSTRPLPVSGGLIFTDVAARNFHTCGIVTEGAVYCWAGTVENEPVALGGGIEFKMLSGGSNFYCGVSEAFEAWCWGLNNERQPPFSEVPRPAVGGLEVETLSSGFNHTCAVTVGGAVYCWGGVTAFAPDYMPFAGVEPRRVEYPATFAAIASGSDFSCGLTVDGKASCWGSNTSGQLGNGSVEVGSNVPVPVSGGFTFSAIAAGGTHACAVTSEGDLYCWGSNGSGQLGDASPFSSPYWEHLSRVPVKVVNPAR